MYVFNRRTGKYMGRAGRPVRDVRTGDMQKMNGRPPDRKGCFGVAVLLVFLGAAPVVAAVLGLLQHVV